MDRLPTEQQECIALFEYAQYNPLLKKYLIHHANEGKRTAWYGNLLKRMGLRPGLLDYQLPIANNEFIGLWFDMKKQNGRNKKKNFNQEAWIDKLLKAGHFACYCYGAGDAIALIHRYLHNEKLDIIKDEDNAHAT